MRGFLHLLKVAILGNDPDTIFELVIENANVVLSKKEIVCFLNSLNEHRETNADVCFSGQGGCRIAKPNLTTLTAFYLSKCGFSVVKTGSTKKTGVIGSTDFYARAVKSYPSRFLGANFVYVDVEQLSPWIKYKMLLDRNISFNKFFQSTVYHECATPIKFHGVRSNIEQQHISRRSHINKPLHYYTFFTVNNGLIIDEIIPSGDVFLNGRCVYSSSRHLNIPQINNPYEIGVDLLCAIDKNSFWYHALRLSTAICLSTIHPNNISLEEGFHQFDEVYK